MIHYLGVSTPAGRVTQVPKAIGATGADIPRRVLHQKHLKGALLAWWCVVGGVFGVG
jgi:hypothetical protein